MRMSLSDGSAMAVAVAVAVADPMRLTAALADRLPRGRGVVRVRPVDVFGVTPPTVSHHPRILREAGLISAERRGTRVYYRVSPAVMARMSAVLVPAS
jgi:ArsR family transcriptional regulator, arsenate/arsenite/antimonite-responsive transcriptional repressor